MSPLNGFDRPAIRWDNHTCLPLRDDPAAFGELDRFRAAGVHVVSVNIGYGDKPLADHVRFLAAIRRWLLLYPDKYMIVSSISDLWECRADGRLGVIFDVEGMAPAIEDYNAVRLFYDLGVRWMLIAYNSANAAGGGCLDDDPGLSLLGRSIIDEMDRVGMVLCLSHTGCKTARDAIEHSRNPVIFSHSNPAGDARHARNISDGLITACAKRGGVIGLSGIGPFLGGEGDLVDSLLRQIFYVIDLVGPDHVGLGLDYIFDRSELDEYLKQNPSLFPNVPGGKLGMIPPERFDEIAEGLCRSNLSDLQVDAVLGGNWMRIAHQVWK